MYRARTITVSNRRGLVHWQVEEGTYFVTLRLADSLPAHVRFRRRKDVEEELDAGHGAALFFQPQLAGIVFDTLKYFDGARYFLHSATVMPNHVHVVLRLAPGQILRHIVRSWKGFSAHEINRVSARAGQVWEREWYDTLIRDERGFARANGYVLANPEKAGLIGWKWVEVFERPFFVRYEEEDGGRSEIGATPFARITSA